MSHSSSSSSSSSTSSLAASSSSSSTLVTSSSRSSLLRASSLSHTKPKKKTSRSLGPHENKNNDTNAPTAAMTTMTSSLSDGDTTRGMWRNIMAFPGGCPGEFTNRRKQWYHQKTGDRDDFYCIPPGEATCAIQRFITFHHQVNSSTAEYQCPWPKVVTSSDTFCVLKSK